MTPPSTTCTCGAALPEGAIRCEACNRRALKKLIKLAAAVGAVLGLLCSQLPAKYKAPCETVAKITSFACGGN